MFTSMFIYDLFYNYESVCLTFTPFWPAHKHTVELHPLQAYRRRKHEHKCVMYMCASKEQKNKCAAQWINHKPTQPNGSDYKFAFSKRDTCICTMKIQTL